MTSITTTRVSSLQHGSSTVGSYRYPWDVLYIKHFRCSCFFTHFKLLELDFHPCCSLHFNHWLLIIAWGHIRADILPSVICFC
jgi:8-oxo-dGTP pyrophosphatase MutT (NUDIX family)